LIGGKGSWRYVEAATVQAETVVAFENGNQPRRFVELKQVMIENDTETAVAAAVVRILQIQRQ
jgi:hypothetical protein